MLFADNTHFSSYLGKIVIIFINIVSHFQKLDAFVKNIFL